MLPKVFLRPIAHRGLHAKAAGVIENTIPAFEAAIARGYGIECDIRPANDGLPLVFHDETIDRLIEGSGPVARLAPGCAAKLRFKHAPVTGIPTLANLLALTAGRVPLMVEIKSEWTQPDARFLAQIATLAAGYAGPLALMSFDPAVMAEIKRLCPSIPRGIVSGSYMDETGEGWWPGKLTPERRRALASLQESVAAAPDFFAYHVKSLPTAETTRARTQDGLPIFAWTVRTADDMRLAASHADAPIFEGDVSP